MDRDLSPPFWDARGSAKLDLRVRMSRSGLEALPLDTWLNDFSPCVDMLWDLAKYSNATGTNGTAVLQVLNTTYLVAGSQIIFGGILGMTRVRTILSIDSATQITVNSAITTVDGETIRNLITPPNTNVRFFVFIPPRDNTVGLTLMDRYGQTGLRISPTGPVLLTLDAGANSQPYYYIQTDGDAVVNNCRVLFF